MRFEHDRHVDQAILVLVADGEAEATQTAAVESHLVGCQDCRSRMATVQALNAFVLTRRQALDHQIPPSDESRARMKELLSLAAEKQAHALRNRLWFFSLPDIWPRYLMRAMVLITLAAFVWFSLFTPVVSAKEFLVRASAAQTTHGPVHRAYRIRLQGKDVDRHSEELQRRGRSIFAAAHLDWDDPLSSKAFARWHDQAGDRRDKVTKSGGQLTLQTTTETAPVREASYTVEAQTWLPVSERVALRDGRNIEIAVIPSAPGASGDSTGAGLPRVPETNAILDSHAIPAEPARAPSNWPTADDSEVLARVALHKLGTVDGSQIEFQRLDDGTLSVRTLVDSEARKQSVLGALAAIPNLRADIRTFAELAGRSARPAPEAAVVATANPAFHRELEITFPNADDRASFVNSVLSESQRASAEAWETGELLRRYGESDIARLRPSTRDAFEGLIREHADALSGAIRTVAERIRPLMPPPEPAAGPVSAGEAWRKTLLVLTQRTLALHEEIQEGLSAASGNRTSEELRRAIISDLQGLESRLDDSRRETLGHFLKKEESNPIK